MDALTSAGAADDGRGIRFTGTWRDYLPIAVTNALLIICTLGIYRFWAAARQRRYLWSRTMFIDDALEWTGTGKEMFFGFLIVMCVLAPFFLFFQFVLPALVAHGQTAAAFLISRNILFRLDLPWRVRPFPRASLSPVADLLARNSRRQRQSRLVVRRRVFWPSFPRRDDDVDRVAVDGRAAVECPLEQDELRAPAVRIRTARQKGSVGPGPWFTSCHLAASSWADCSLAAPAF